MELSLEPLEVKSRKKAHGEGRAAEEALGRGVVKNGRLIEENTRSLQEIQKANEEIAQEEEKLAMLHYRRDFEKETGLDVQIAAMEGHIKLLKKENLQ